MVRRNTFLENNPPTGATAVLYSGVCLFSLGGEKNKTKQNKANQNTGQLQLSVTWERELYLLLDQSARSWVGSQKILIGFMSKDQSPRTYMSPGKN